MADAWDQFPDAQQNDTWSQFPDAQQATPAQTGPRKAADIPYRMEGGARVSTDPKVVLSNYGRDARPAEGLSYEEAGLEYKAPSWRDILGQSKKNAVGGIRQVGRVGRDVAQGGLGLEALALDAIPATATKLATGKAQFPFSQSLAQLDNPALADRNMGERYTSALTRALAGAGTGMGIGGTMGGAANPTVAGIGNTLANPVGQTAATVGGVMGSQTAKEMGGGPIAQMAAGIGGALLPGGTSFLVQKLRAATPEAQALMDRGVQLTPGQQKPGGIMDQLESAQSDYPILGPAIKNAREAAKFQAKEAFIAQAAAPGVKIKPTGELSQTLDDVYQSFEPAYDQVHGFPLRLKNGQPVIMRQGQDIPLRSEVAKVVTNKSYLASPQVRKMAGDFLENQLQRGATKSEDLLKIRQDLRAEIRAIRPQTSDERALRMILEGAEEKITESLESQLPNKLLSILKPVDRQYAKYKIAEDAVASGKDTDFTFNQASAAAKRSAEQSLGKGKYARGEGMMREIPKAAKKVFNDSPPTGARIAAQVGGLPMFPMTLLGATTKFGRNALGGGRPPGPFRAQVNPVLNKLAVKEWEDNP